jgi:hypothetical protein
VLRKVESLVIREDKTLDFNSKVNAALIVKSKAKLTVSANCSLLLSENGRIVIEDGSFIIGDNAQISADNHGVNNSILVKGGNLTLGNNVIFNKLSGGVLLVNSGKMIYDNNKQYNLSHATFNNTKLTHNGCNLSISDCVFNRGSDVITSASVSSINNCTFNGTSFLSEQTQRVLGGTELINVFKPYTYVTNSIFNGNNRSGIALQINNSNGIVVLNNRISGYSTGICLKNSGATLSLKPEEKKGDMIYNNNVSLCDKAGIELYNSVADFKGNNIHDNGFGVKLYNNSYTAFDNNGHYVSNHQIIKDNEDFELYVSAEYFPLNFHWNQIIDEDNLGGEKDPLIYFDYLGYSRILENMNHNYWGYKFDIREDLYPYGTFRCDTIWDPYLSKAISQSNEELLYQSGLENFANEDYTTAETTFTQLITNYPESEFAIAAMHELFALKQFTDQNFETLHDYYSNFTEADSMLYDIAQFLATRCNVADKNWQPAIDWYENRIANPPSYPDSIFAVIDLGDIHLQMEADTIGMELKAKPFILSRFPNLKPKSRIELEKNSSDLLATLPQRKSLQKEQSLNGNTKGALQQNIPNPASESTTILYELYAAGNVEIQIYNVLGQQVQTKPIGMKKAGVFEAKISLKTIPSGLYEYALVVDGARVDTKKMTVSK